MKIHPSTAILLTLALGLAAPVDANTDLVTIDRFVPHISAAPANAGQRVGLYVREKFLFSIKNLSVPLPTICLHCERSVYGPINICLR